MSLLSWLFLAGRPAQTQAESSGLSRMEPTRPAVKRPGSREPAPGNGQPANRKGERMAQRELLYAVVRECMVHAGVLSSSYKFKVLSLDARGRQFLVMVDLASDQGGETARLAEIEAMIAQSAKTRHDILVSAVYWRTNEHVAVGNAGAGARQRPLDSRPAPLDSQPAALEPPVAKRTASPYEPIQPDEVEAFKRAMAAGLATPAAVAAAAVDVAAHGASAKGFDGAGVHGPQSYILLTGFEDTEMPDPEHRMPSLSGTQYGDLA